MILFLFWRVNNPSPEYASKLSVRCFVSGLGFLAIFLFVPYPIIGFPAFLLSLACLIESAKLNGYSAGFISAVNIQEGLEKTLVPRINALSKQQGEAISQVAEIYPEGVATEDKICPRTDEHTLAHTWYDPETKKHYFCLGNASNPSTGSVGPD